MSCVVLISITKDHLEDIKKIRIYYTYLYWKVFKILYLMNCKLLQMLVSSMTGHSEVYNSLIFMVNLFYLSILHFILLTILFSSITTHAYNVRCAVDPTSNLFIYLFIYFEHFYSALSSCEL
jgi:hypothetical protein